MNEPNDTLSEMLKGAIESARAAGRHDVADYLALRAANDAVRQAGVQWLLDSLIEIAMDRRNDHLGIAVDRTEPHSFSHLNANLTGSRINVRHGVRCLSVEAGWTRTPADGFMRGGAMAVARITHFGLPKQNENLYLVPTEGLPAWKNADSVRDAKAFTINDLKRHFAVLID